MTPSRSSPLPDRRRKSWTEYLLPSLVGFLAVIVSVASTAMISALNRVGDKVEMLSAEVASIKQAVSDSHEWQLRMNNDMEALKREVWGDDAQRKEHR